MPSSEAISPKRLDAARYAISAIFFVDGCALGGWAGRIPDAKVQFGLDDRQLGFVLLGLSIGAISTMPLATLLISRFGSRRVSLVTSYALLCIPPLLFLLPTPIALTAGLAVLGAINGQVDVAMNTHSMTVQDRIPRPVLSAVHGWFSMGSFAGGIGASLSSWLGIGPVPQFVASSIVLAAVLAATQRHLLPTSLDQQAESGGLALPRGALWALGALVTISFAAEGVIWDWAAVFLRQERAAPAWIAPLGFALACLSLAAGRFAGDFATARLGRTRLFGLSAGLTATGILLAVSAASIPIGIVGFALAGLGLANLVPLVFRAAAVAPGFPPGYGLAAVTVCGYGAFLAAPPLVGFVASRSSLGNALSGVAVVVLLLAVFARRVEEPTRR